MEKNPMMEKRVLPLHPAQLDIYLDQLIHADNPQYNTGGYIRLLGRLHKASFSEALRSVLNVFDAFKMRFDHPSAGPGFYLSAQPADAGILELDFSGFENPRRAAAEWMQEEFNIPFNIKKDHLLFKHAILKIADNEHWSYNKYHHLITDGYGFAIWAQYIAGKYTSLISGTPYDVEFPSYVKAARDQEGYFGSENYKADKKYWSAKIGTRPAKLFQPLAAQENTPTAKSGTHTVLIGEEQRMLLDALQKEHRCSLQQLTIAALAAYLGKTMPAPEFIFGIPIHKRGSKVLRRTVGTFSGMIPFKAAYNKDHSPAEFLQEVKRAQQNDYRHLGFVLSDFFQSASHEKPFGIIINYELLDFETDFGDQLSAETFHLLSEFETTPLTICWRDFGAQQPLELRVDFLYAYFKQEEAEMLVARVLKLLHAFHASPHAPLSGIEILTSAERQCLLETFNDTAVPYPVHKTVTDLFEEQVKRTPGSIAVACEGKELSYRELDERSNQLANYLRRSGVAERDIVPVCLRPGIEMIISMLGIIKSGAAYLPIDPKYPVARLSYMLEDAGAKLVLSSSGIEALQPLYSKYRVCCIDKEKWGAEPRTKPPLSITGTDLLYVIYTSGSTGKPKGAGVYHHSAVNLLTWYTRELGISGEDRNIIISSFGFDLTQKNIFSTLCAGGCLVLPSLDYYDAAALASYIEAQQATIVNCTPSAFYPFAEDAAVYSKLASLRWVVLGGEPIKIPFLEEWIQSKPAACQIINTYGPTECTDTCSSYILHRPLLFMSEAVPIGKPNNNAILYILSEELQLQPLGVPGQICISGQGVGAGYLNDPLLTAAKFINNPFGSGKLYLTGDLGKWLPDGNMLYLGRVDEQVKIRGYRIELGEIESVLQQQPCVAQAVVVARERAEGIKDLVAYIVPRAAFDQAAVTAALKAALPEYMVPFAFVEVETIPLTANGKTDRKALSQLEVIAGDGDDHPQEPGNDIEHTLLGIWKNLLGIKSAGINADFFHLGGNSLLATRLVSLVRKKFYVELSVKDIFEKSTIAALASHIRLLDEQAFQQIPKAIRPENIPASFAQQSLWYIDKLEGSLHYQLPLAWKMKGKPDVAALEAALRHIVSRHEVLRTVLIEMDGQPYQSIRNAGSWRLDVRSGESRDNYEEDIRTFLNTAFDLSGDHMLRACLTSYSAGEHLLLLKIHHIAMDGWSVGIFMRELRESYLAACESRSPVLEELPVQYADYALWQRNYLSGDIPGKKLGYWKEQLEGLTALDLPVDSPSTAALKSEGALYEFSIGQELKEKLALLSQQEGATLFMSLKAVFHVLMHRYTGQEDICTGMPAANRTQSELEDLLGFFVNSLPVRTRLKGDLTFLNVLHQMQDAVLNALIHQDIPFEKVVEAASKHGHPLFRVMFAFQEEEDVDIAGDFLPGVELAREKLPHTTSKFDLTFFITNGIHGLKGAIEYRTGLYSSDTIGRMAAHYVSLLHAFAGKPTGRIGTAPLLPAAEEALLRHTFNTTGNGPDPDLNTTIVALFEEQAAKTPQHIALVAGETRLTYQELNALSNQLAGHLREKCGIRPDDIVGIKLPKNEWLVAAIIAVLKAGGAYLPMDPEHPAARLDRMIAESNCRLVIDAGMLEQLVSAKDEGSRSNPAPVNSPADLAYVIFTSGSTGRPKGVMAEHKALVNLCRWHQQRFAVTARDKATLYANVMFDASVWELFPYLASGACLYIVPQEIRLSADDLAGYYDANGITISFLPTPMGEQFMKASNRSLRYLLVGGDKLNQYAATPYQVVNNYGPTENTVVTTSFNVQGPKANIPIGKPINNVTLFVLNAEKALCPIGVKGELYIAGAGLARGYINDPALTAEKFVPDPFGTGTRMYKTCDLARWLPDGTLEFIGRSDEQVKIRGFRIELSEVESALKEYPGIGMAAVVVAGPEPGDKKLLAYFEGDDEMSVAAIRDFLKDRLPAYMQPAHYLQVKAFVRTPGGKIDKKQLPPFGDFGVTGKTGFTAPETGVEKRLLAIWQKILGLDGFGVLDNFFDLGGHSMLATRVTWAIRREFEVEMSIADLFRYPTIREIGASISSKAAGATANTLAKQVRPALLPLSFAQERLWILDQVKGSIQYHIPAALRLSGPLEPAVLEQALRGVVNRHEVLRTVVRQEDNKPYQLVMPEGLWSYTKIQAQAAIEANTLELQIQELAERPFDLSADHMLRASLIGVNKEEHVLVIVLHHIAADGWSLPILIKELAALYEALISQKHSELSALSIQYADFAIWQRNYMEGEILNTKLQYWKDKLGDMAPLDLPAAFSRPSVLSSRGAAVEHNLTPALGQQLQQLSRAQGVTLFITMLAAFKLLLRRYSGQDEICVGSPTADRLYESCDPLIGLFVNTVALRTRLKEDADFLTILRDVKQTALEAYEHQDVPFEKIVQEVAKERDLSRTPVFQVMFAMQSQESATPGSGFLKGLAARKESVPVTTAIFEITLNVCETADGINLQAAYSTDLYDARSMQSLLQHYEQLLTAVAANPRQPAGQVEILTKAEKEQLLLGFNATRMAVPVELSLADLLERQAAATPGSTALVYRAESVTYRELNERANRLAHFLRQRGVKENSLVPVCLNRNAEMIVTILAVLKAGCAYVPVDPEYPAERIRHILRDTNASLVLGSSDTRKKIPANFDVLAVDEAQSLVLSGPAEDPARHPGNGSLAYLIYTSGSTGNPKGVKIRHSNVVNFLTWADTLLHGAEHNFLASTSVCFDISILEIFLPLVTGGRLTLVSSVLDYFSGTTAKEVTFLNMVPSALRALLLNGTIPAVVRTIILAGEPLKLALVKECYTAGFKGKLYNMYGPTETTVYSTFSQVDKDDKAVSIGRPAGNTRIYILDGQLQMQPVGVPGEIFIGGKGVTGGYLHRQELTEERFIKDPYEPGAIVYRTGDVGLWRPDGSIMLQNRTDNQVKIKGFRIELGEIEHALHNHPDIDEAVVLAVDTLEGGKQLDAYIVSKKNLHVFDLREYLGGLLPAYMLPANFIKIDEIPLTPNGKTDRKKLGKSKGLMLSKQAGYIAPGNSAEREMLQIWQKVLEADRISVKDNFFDLGGSSAKAIQMVGLVNRSFATNVEVLTAFKHPTIRDFAAQALLAQKPGEAWLADPPEEVDETVAIMKQTINLLNNEYDDNE